MRNQIPSFAINLEKRIDRRNHISNEFIGKPEFNLHIVKAIEHQNGDDGLWLTISHIVQNLINHDDDFCLILEDDHQFTNYYDYDFLISQIQIAKSLGAEVLLGGVSWFNRAIPSTKNLFEIDSFNATQFVIILKSFYKKFIDKIDQFRYSADINISKIASKKFLIYPFISIQKEFGYSDATSFNSEPGYVTKIFENSRKRLRNLNIVCNYYDKLIYDSKLLSNAKNSVEDSQLDITIPVYVLKNSSPNEGLDLFQKEFESRNEFNVKIFNSESSNSEEQNTEWLELIESVKEAQAANDHFIVVARTCHRFSTDFNFNEFIKQIKDAHDLGAKILYGNGLSITDATYLTRDLFWVSDVVSSSFTVIYKSIFEKILTYKVNPFRQETVDGILASLTSNKVIPLKFCGYEKNIVFLSKLEENSIALNKIKSANLTTYQNHQFLYDKMKGNDEVSFFGNIDAPYYHDRGEDYFLQDISEEKIIIIVPFFNTGNYLIECYNSLFNQKYKNFEVILIDDCSNDFAIDKIPESSQLKKVRIDKRSFALCNIYTILSNIQCSDEAIIMILDGDDYLAHNNVLRNLNYNYQRYKCLISYGQYFTTEKQYGHCLPYNEDEFKRLRKIDWRASHLKSFKYKLFKEFNLQDPDALAFKDDNGLFFEMTYDIALMIPLLEIAGFSKCYYNRDINYIYRIHDQNDAMKNRDLQIQIENEIKNKASFVTMFNN